MNNARFVGIRFILSFRYIVYPEYSRTFYYEQ
jgi:hypothetical protein